MSGPSAEHLKELAAAYVLGALGEAEARAFAGWLETSPEGQREVTEFRELQALLAIGTPGPKPPANLRGVVLAHATRKREATIAPATSRPTTGGRRASPALWLALAASVIALIGVSVSRVRLQQRLSARDTTIAALQQDLASTDALRLEQEATLKALLEPGVTLTRLTAQGGAAPEIQFFWNRKNQVAVASAAGLAPSASGRVYQLWFIPKKGNPIPSVTFTVDASGRALLTKIPVPADQELAAAAVTDEPAGGSVQPTTTPFLVGTL